MQGLLSDFTQRDGVYFLMHPPQCGSRKLIGNLNYHVENRTDNRFMRASTARIPNRVDQPHRELLISAHEAQYLMASPDDFDMQGITEKMINDVVRNNPFGEFLRIDFAIVELIVGAEVRIALEIVHVMVIVSLVIVDILIVLDFSDNFGNVV